MQVRPLLGSPVLLFELLPALPGAMHPMPASVALEAVNGCCIGAPHDGFNFKGMTHPAGEGMVKGEGFQNLFTRRAVKGIRHPWC